jgi:adenylate kinase family enzyme
MIKRVHIFGAAGSGTTTIAKALACELNCDHFDTDDYFWKIAYPEYINARPVEERQKLLSEKLSSSSNWILSGSLCGWGDIFILYFELVVFVYLHKDIRMERLQLREYQRYGNEIYEGGNKHQDSKVFLEWAASYDDSKCYGRNLNMHEEWLKTINCPILKVKNDCSIDESVNVVLNAMGH